MKNINELKKVVLTVELLLNNFENLINKELERYHAVTSEELMNESRVIFNENNCNTLYYYAAS
jgi:hypothetical protein